MYQHYFGLEGKPFSITPDPRFLYMSPRHREALAHLLYGIGEGGGFVQLTGEVGTGKTTLSRCLLEKIPDDVDVALILNPKLNAFELLATICDELKIDYPADVSSIKTLIDPLNDYLLKAHAAGRRTVLIIDEAQNLSPEVLEQIRLLTNLETTRNKLLQIILIGQPELKERLERTDMRQLAQRVTARYHLEPLSLRETRAYIEHRIKVSDGTGNLFTRAALREVHRLCGGIPRMINILCDRALLGAYVEEKARVDSGVVHRAAAEVLPEQATGVPSWTWGMAAALALAIPTAWIGWYFGSSLSDHGRAPSELVSQNESVAELSRLAAEAAEPDLPRLAEASVLTSSLAVDLEASPSLEGDDNADIAIGPNLAALLDNAGASAVLQSWVGLFEIWHVPLWLDGQLQPCQQAEREGLRCLSKQGNWTQLSGLNRPAILELIDASGRQIPVLLRQLLNDHAELVIAGRAEWFTRAAVDRHWRGSYVLLWKPPVSATSLRVGDRGPSVHWLRGQLDHRLGPAARQGDPALFDHFLQQRVKQFQAQRSLSQDGVVGTETMIHLNSLNDSSSVPLLQPASS